VPLASFSDLAFLLLLYFIVATTLVQPFGITVDFPAGKKATQQDEQKDAPRVNLKDNQVFFKDDLIPGDRPTVIKQLNAKLATLNLAAMDASDPKRVVPLEAAGKVDYDLYLQVMAAISAAGGQVGIIQEQ